MKTLVIGYGSIGQRHSRLLKQLGCDVAVLSRRPVDFSPSYLDLKEALQKHRPEYAVIANETVLHDQTLNSLFDFGFSGAVLVEKPLFHNSHSFRFSTDNIWVGYNLRFHPILTKLKSLLDGQNILSAQAYVGKYLPEWRPQLPYDQCYSAKKTAGGGVLRDLSHELDFLFWMLGTWTDLTASGGHWSHLNIDSDDVFAILLRTERCRAVTVQMNYLDRMSRRELVINTDEHTFKADLIHNELWIDKEKESFSVDRDSTYIAQHQAIMNRLHSNLCTFEAGARVIKAIEAAEDSTKNRRWVSV